jgi:hypothetical protein
MLLKALDVETKAELSCLDSSHASMLLAKQSDLAEYDLLMGWSGPCTPSSGIEPVIRGSTGVHLVSGQD